VFLLKRPCKVVNSCSVFTCYFFPAMEKASTFIAFKFSLLFSIYYLLVPDLTVITYFQVIPRNLG
jgi:hypothetical protein